MVLVEAVSVIVRRKTIEEKYPGGWKKYIESAPNSTLCADDNISRLGFMMEDDAESFVKALQEIGFEYQANGKGSEIAIVNQGDFKDEHFDWLEKLRFKIDNNKNYIYACRLKGDESTRFCTPIGWNYDHSLSREYGIVFSGQSSKCLKYLRHENGLDVYLNILTSKEVYVNRTGTLLKK